MVKTCKVEVVKDTHKIVYDDDEYEKLTCEAHLSSKGNQPLMIQEKLKPRLH
jgi:hypothetical protein